MKFSVIMPVYNAEKYLHKSISSVIHQVWKNWELIAVDDGSTDNSLEILNQYSQDDNRVKVVHQENRGPGSARNNGLSLATGDYVVFLDSDDYIDEEYFSLLAPLAERNDVVFIDCYQVDDNGKLLCKEKMSDYIKWSLDRITRSQLTGKIPWGGVRKAVSLELLRKNHIQYTNHENGEEALYSFRVMLGARAVAFLDSKPVYFYVNHEGSQSKKPSFDPWGGVVDTIRNYMKETGMYELYADTLNAFDICALIVSIDRMSNCLSGKNLRRAVRERRLCFNSSFDKQYGVDKKNVSFKAKVFIPLVNCGLMYPVVIASRIRSGIRKRLHRSLVA